MKKTVNDCRITVLGAGTMGLRIAQFFAMKGHAVRLYNRTESRLCTAMEQIRSNLNMLRALDQISDAEIEETIARLDPGTELETAVDGADLVIESVAEDVAVKQEMFRRLDALCPADTIFASDTSTMDIYAHIQISHPERLIIMHFFNPAYVMPLVEVVRGPETSDEVTAFVKELLTACGKTVATLNKVIPGFLLNRLTFSLLREACYIVEQGVCTPADVDAAIVANFGPRYAFEGIFGLMDAGGMAVEEMLSTRLNPVLCDSKACSPVIHELVEEGNMGISTGKGFFEYEDSLEAFRIRDEKIIRMIQAIKQVNDQVK